MYRFLSLHLPVNGNDIAARMQIEHYPVLITAISLEQCALHFHFNFFSFTFGW